MKLIKRFVSWTIWGIIALNLMLMGISHIPAAQQFIGSKIANVVGQKLGTQVYIGRVDLGFLNRVIVNDVLIFDQQHKEMVRVARLSAKIDIAPLMNGKIAISSAQLFGARLSLYQQTTLSKPNFQFVLDSLASKDTTTHTPLDLRINSLIMRRSSLSFHQRFKPHTEGLFNLAHLRLNNINADINLRTLTDDSLNVNIKRLECHESSGLDIERISLKLDAGKHSALLTNLHVVMPSSLLQIDTLSAQYQIESKRLVPGSLSFYGIIKDTGITPSDLRCFNNSFKNFQRQILVNSHFNGTDRKLTIPSLSIATNEKDIDILANGSIEDWQHQPRWHVEMNHANLSEQSIDFLAKSFPQIPREIVRIGSLQLSARADKNEKGTTSLLANVSSGAGHVNVSFDITADKHFLAQVATPDLNIRQLLDNDHFGKIATDIALSGIWHDKQNPDVTANGAISHFDYNGYTYNNIHLNSSYTHGHLMGAIDIDDPNVKIQLNGDITDDLFLKNKAKKVKLQGAIIHLAPQIAHLTDQFGKSVISANIDADFTAHNLNDAQGNIRISNFSVSATDTDQAYNLDNLMLTSGYDEGIHFLTLKSDFADAELRGKFDYNTLAQSIANAVGSKLPTLPGLPPLNNQTDNNFSLRLLLSKTDWLNRFLGVNLQLQQPIMLQAQINDLTRAIQLNGEFPSFAYNDAWYSDGSITIDTPADTMKCNANFTKLMDNGHHLSLGLQADASNNNIKTALRWDNKHPQQRMSGELNVNVLLYRNLDNKPEAHMRISPSHVILQNSTWNLEPSDILYNEDHLLVDHFSVHHGQEHIIVDGIASKRPADSLIVDLNQVEVSYILDLVNFHSVEFSGRATGRAKATQLFSDFDAHADLQVDEFKFEKGRMGILHAKAAWNKEAQQIDIQAFTDDGNDSKTYIEGYVSPIHNTIDLAFDAQGTYIDFMHNFTNTFLSSITGRAEGKARLAGTLDNINLTGQIVVDGEATVTSLNTTYTLQRDTVIMIPDEIELRHLRIHDRDGHTAYVSGGIHHKHLTSMTFDLSVEAENLLAYDFTDFGDSNFYGTVYASGNVTIQGLPNEVIINCNVTPEKNSVFTYNAANPNAISRQEFIHWEENDSRNVEGGKWKENSSATDFYTPQNRTDIYINFLVNTTPDATMRLLMDANTKDYITLNGEGTIRATYHNKGPFNMFGTYTIDHGTYGITIQNIIKKNFTFNKGGTIIFGGDPYNAALNMQAMYTVNGVSLSDLNIGNSFSSNTIRVNCLMNISGQPNAPQVDFDLEMPNVNADEQQMVRSVINGQQEMNQQVLYLLGIGRFYTQNINNNNGQQSDQTSLAMQSFLSGTLSTQINTLLSQVIKNDNWNFGANISTGNEGWHNAEYEGIINGRLFNNRLLFNGQFGYRDNATQATPSFIGDFDVQYLLYPNGNLALKVYNQTNDRYFTKSALNTQGIGLIMKKDFDGLGDLFSSKKKKKKKSAAADVKEDHTQQNQR